MDSRFADESGSGCSAPATAAIVAELGNHVLGAASRHRERRGEGEAVLEIRAELTSVVIHPERLPVWAVEQEARSVTISAFAPKKANGSLRRTLFAKA